MTINFATYLTAASVLVLTFITNNGPKAHKFKIGLSVCTLMFIAFQVASKSETPKTEIANLFYFIVLNTDNIIALSIIAKINNNTIKYAQYGIACSVVVKVVLLLCSINLLNNYYVNIACGMFIVSGCIIEIFKKKKKALQKYLPPLSVFIAAAATDVATSLDAIVFTINKGNSFNIIILQILGSAIVVRFFYAIQNINNNWIGKILLLIVITIGATMITQNTAVVCSIVIAVIICLIHQLRHNETNSTN